MTRRERTFCAPAATPVRPRPQPNVLRRIAGIAGIDRMCRVGRRFLPLLALFLAMAVGAPPATAKYASIVVDAETGDVLHEINADTRNYPASLTKIMTLYMVFDALEKGNITLDKRLKVSRRAARQPPSKLGLKAGSRITVKDAILALVTKSANDAAVTIAEALGGSERKFARTMTKKAHEIGMTRSNFRNASGLPNRHQLSTARDMALLGRRIREDFPDRYHYFASEKFRWKGRTYRNHNNLLRKYTGSDGVKTGYIRASGFNLVAAVERDGRRLVGVVFGGKSVRSRDRHMMRLLDKGFRESARIAEMEQKRSKKTSKVDSADAAIRRVVAATVSALGPRPPERPIGNPFTDETVTEADFAGEWVVQVGAFKFATTARKAAENIRAKLGARGHELTVVLSRRGTNGLYRARLAGLDGKRDALGLCRQLKKKRIDCLAVAPTKRRQLASN